MPPGFVPHLSNLELIRQAGIFYPRITDLTGKHTHTQPGRSRTNEIEIQILISNFYQYSSTSPINIQLQYRCRKMPAIACFAPSIRFRSITNYLHFQFPFPYMIKVVSDDDVRKRGEFICMRIFRLHRVAGAVE